MEQLWTLVVCVPAVMPRSLVGLADNHLAVPRQPLTSISGSPTSTPVAGPLRLCLWPTADPALCLNPPHSPAPAAPARPPHLHPSVAPAPPAPPLPPYAVPPSPEVHARQVRGRRRFPDVASPPSCPGSPSHSDPTTHSPRSLPFGSPPTWGGVAVGQPRTTVRPDRTGEHQLTTLTFPSPSTLHRLPDVAAQPTPQTPRWASSPPDTSPVRPPRESLALNLRASPSSAGAPVDGFFRNWRFPCDSEPNSAVGSEKDSSNDALDLLFSSFSDVHSSFSAGEEDPDPAADRAGPGSAAAAPGAGRFPTLP
eukprot:EG_transcript_12566